MPQGLPHRRTDNFVSNIVCLKIEAATQDLTLKSWRDAPWQSDRHRWFCTALMQRYDINMSSSHVNNPTLTVSCGEEERQHRACTAHATKQLQCSCEKISRNAP